MRTRDRIFLIGMGFAFGWLFDWLKYPAWTLGYFLIAVVFLFDFFEWIEKEEKK